MVDKYKKGRRIYTHWDKKTEQVTVVPKNKTPDPASVREIQVELPAEHAAGRRADYFIISSTADEVVIDCGLTQPAAGKIIMASRIIVPPRTMKKLMLALQEYFEDDQN